MQTIHLNAYPDPAPKKWVGPDPENHIGSTPLVPQDSGMTKWMVGPVYLTLVRGKHPTAHCVPAPLITVHQLCMLDTEHIVSTVICKFNSQKCYSVDCCFVLGWWVQCHVPCQNDAVPAEVDETHSHMKPVVVLETLNLDRWIISSRNLHSCFWKFWKLRCNTVVPYWWYLCRKNQHTHTHI